MLDLAPHTRCPTASLGTRMTCRKQGDARVLQPALVEEVGGEGPDGRVHAVLHAQHRDRVAQLLEPLEQGTLQQACPGCLAQHGRRQLLRIPDQHSPAQHAGRFEKALCTGVYESCM